MGNNIKTFNEYNEIINEEFLNFRSSKQLKQNKYDEIDSLLDFADDNNAFMGGLSENNMVEFIERLLIIFDKYDFSDDNISTIKAFLNNKISETTGNVKLFWEDVLDYYKANYEDDVLKGKEAVMENVKIEEYLKIEVEEEDGDIEVNYQTNKYGDDMEITGILEPYNTGRMTDYKFEPDWFDSKKTEDIYNQHWEDIEEEIKNEYYSK